jgi:hypothetical protein
MLKSLEKKEEMISRYNSGVLDAVTNRSIDNLPPERSTSNKIDLSKARLRHLMPKKFKSKQSSPLPFIYDKLNK